MGPFKLHATVAVRHGGGLFEHAAAVCGSGLACGKHVRLQFFSAIVTSAAMYSGELWGVHPRTAAERGRTAQKHTSSAAAVAALTQHQHSGTPSGAGTPVLAATLAASGSSVLECAGSAAGGGLQL